MRLLNGLAFLTSYLRRHDTLAALPNQESHSQLTLGWFLSIGAGLLVVAAGEGPDFGSYTDWSAAALTGDIFSMRGNVLSPTGVPFTIAAAGPGLLFAIGKAVLLPLTLVSAALVTGWVAAIVFWGCSLIVLRRVAEGRDGLALFGAGALFIGTHVGLYSHAYATEVFANALIAALWAVALTRTRWRWIDSAMVGALAGLLLLVRAHVVLYGIPALWVAVLGTPLFASAGGAEGPPLPSVHGYGRSRLAGAALQPRARSAAFLVRAVAAGVPMAIAVAEYATVNRWMTGSWLHPPYVYGGAGFSSVDLSHPEFAAVLLHPWHGLLAYHPLYGVAFVAVVVQAWRRTSWRVLWATTALAAVLHVWVQAGWYIWWLGGTTFGMRGLAPAALPLIAGLVAAIRGDMDSKPMRAALWMCTATLACAWSYPLLLRGNTQFHSWGALLAAQTPALIAIAVVVTVAAITILRTRPFTAVAVERRSHQLSIVLGAVILFYLAFQATQMPDMGTRTAAGLIATALIASWFRLPPLGTERATAIAAGIVLIVFSAQAGLFARLALRAERHVASGAAPRRAFAYVSASPVDELRVTYAEYREVPGFDTQKAAFRRFLAWQRIAATPMSSADRRIAEAVRQRLEAEPMFGDLLVESTAREGGVRITAPGITDRQRLRARELALTVPGTRSVTFLP